MSELTPTRSVVLELQEERRAMRDGHVFLDEKCLLLAAEILAELRRYETMLREFLAEYAAATVDLQRTIARHGLHGLQVYPAAPSASATLRRTSRSLMGVRLQEAELVADSVPASLALDPSPEAKACCRAFAALLAKAAPLAAIAGNLQRLCVEYRRSVRRARALQDVLLPEIDRDLYDLESRLEETEQEDAISMHQRH